MKACLIYIVGWWNHYKVVIHTQCLPSRVILICFHKNINMFIEKTEVYDVRKDWWIRRKISYLSNRFITFAVHYHPAVNDINYHTACKYTIILQSIWRVIAQNIISLLQKFSHLFLFSFFIYTLRCFCIERSIHITPLSFNTKR